MTLLNFPPTNGQPTDGTFTYTANGVIYAWDGEKWTANSEQGLDSNYVNIDGDTMTGDLTVPSLNGGPLAGFRNQIINGDFRVWQRGTQFLTLQDGYSADHWFTTAGTNTRPTQRANVTLPGFTYGVEVSGVGTAPSITQPIELTAAGVAGQFVGTWTISFWTNNTDVGTSLLFSDGGEGRAGNYATNTEVGNLEPIETAAGGWVRMSQTYAMVAPNASNICLIVNIYGNTAGDTFQLTGAQLEPGPVATPFEHRPIGTELALCQRYYQRHDIVSRFVVSGTAVLQAYNYTFPFPQTMRSAPTPNREGNSARTSAAAFASVTTDVSTAYLQATNANTNTLQGAGDYSFDAEL